MSIFKWTVTACLMMGLTFVTVGCDTPAEPPVEETESPEIETGTPAEDPAVEEVPVDETPAEEAPTEE